MFIFDFNTQNASKVSSPKENAVAGTSLIVADDATVLIMGGTVRNYCVFTSKLLALIAQYKIVQKFPLYNGYIVMVVAKNGIICSVQD